MKQNEIFDVIVIGGGPSGMIAAGRAAACGARVLMLEKNDRLGVKLLMTGGGRCNLTHAGEDRHGFIDRLGKKGKFLHSAFAHFGVKESIAFFATRGVTTRIEKDGCVFPESDRSRDIVGALEGYMREHTVTVVTSSPVKKLTCEQDIFFAATEKEVYRARRCILAVGGCSYPSTGSSGDGFTFAQAMGHTVEKVRPALAPIVVKEPWIKELQGSSGDARILVMQNMKKRAVSEGALMCTHEGLSGPVIMNVSSVIGELLTTGGVQVSVDFSPAITKDIIEKRLKHEVQEHATKMIKNILESYGTAKMVQVWLKRTGIEGGRKGITISGAERAQLVEYMKHMTFHVVGVSGFDKAMVTAGGVALKEINGKTMQSNIQQNLFIVGELLDLDGPCGGYNLQIAWTTGYIAGEAAGNKR